MTNLFPIADPVPCRFGCGNPNEAIKEGHRDDCPAIKPLKDKETHGED